MDRRATLLSIILPPLVAAGFVLGFYTAEARQHRAAEGDPSVKVREVAREVEERFYGPVQPEKLEHGAVDGMLATLDPYCQYFTASEWKEFNETSVEGKFGGVGILIDSVPDHGYHRVLSPLAGSPALEKDILPGDLMTRVDGKDVKDLPIDQLKERIRATAAPPSPSTLCGRKSPPRSSTTRCSPPASATSASRTSRR
jgi:C-terminal processing protease CtpA/Prc